MNTVSDCPSRQRPFAVRPAGPADAPAIRDVHEASIRGMGPERYTAAEVESWVGNLTHEGYVRHMAEGERYLVAVAAGAAAGGAIVAFCGFQGDEVKALYVAPAWVGRGVGSALLALAEQAIAAEGHGRIRIGASLTGEAFYTARGYAVVARKPWTSRGGLVLDSVDMERSLAINLERDGGTTT